ncbi:MAG TPA: hypothetical protein VMH86_12370 [Rhizomicrobium sp.]|nr:hypothetical protein [Rhizomicrobium sp.]
MRRVLKIGGMVLAIVVLLAGLGAGGFYGMLAYFYPDPPAKDYPRPANLLQAQRQDLDYFSKLQAMDRSYPPAARAEMQREVAAMEKADTPLSPQAFQVRLMQISALADNGHTHVRMTGPDVVPNLLPVRVTDFQEGLFVMRARTPDKDMLGGRLESIDGTPVDEIVARLKTLRGGTSAFRMDNAALFAADQDMLYGLGIARAPMESTWTVRLPDGREVTRTLKAYDKPESDALDYGYRWTDPAPVKGLGPDWVSYEPASGHLPESRRDLDRVFEDLAIPGSCARYIRLADIIDTDGQKIEPALERFESELRADRPCAAIVDLRGNGGGDYTNAWHFSHALPSLVAPDGRIFILTNAGTFSAAITTTAFIKEAGGDRVTIVGEPVGDRLEFYAEGNEGCLPNSKLCASYETGKHAYDAPCTDWHDCFWLNWFYPVRVKTLRPDQLIASRFADWNAGHDVAFERAVEMAGKAR